MVTQRVTMLNEQDSLNEEYTRSLSWEDLVVRALRNPKYPPIYFRLYVSLVYTYPQLLEGESVEIEVWRVRENAGWAPERSTTNFFQDMVAIDAIAYLPGKYEKKVERRVGKVTPTPDIFDAPESFDTSGTERKRKAKDAEAKRRSQFMNPHTLFPCSNCGSTLVDYTLVPTCTQCGHKDEPLENIPAAAITIDAEIIDVQEENQFLDEPTRKLASIPKTPVLVQAVLPSPQVGMHPRKIACPACRKKDQWYAHDTSYGTKMYVCRCTPLE
jgi:hypothetical protein